MIMESRDKGLYLVNLSDHCIHNLSFKWPKHNGLVFYRVQHETPAGLYDTGPDIINCSHCNDKAISTKSKRDTGQWYVHKS